MASIMRGTTPTNRFVLPESFKEMEITGLYITYSQENKVVLEKVLDEVEIDGNVITVQLSQPETMRFNSKYSIDIQIAVRSNELVYRSDIITSDCKKILHDEEI